MSEIKTITGSSADIIALEKKCIVSFRTKISSEGNLELEYTTEERPYDTEYYLKIKEIYYHNFIRNLYFIKVRRIRDK